MIRNDSELDWEFLADEDRKHPWPSCPPVSTGKFDAVPRHFRVRLVLFATTMLMLLMAGIGATYAYSAATDGVQEVEEGVEAAVSVEQWVQAHAPELSADMLVDDGASDYVVWMMDRERQLLAAVANEDTPAVDLYVGDTWFSGTYAAAEVALHVPVSDEEAIEPLRQTRFYRESDAGWTRTKPVPALWGRALALETDNLIWRYRSRDEDDVLAVAEEIDKLYTVVLADYALPTVQDDEKLVVRVDVDVLPGKVTRQNVHARELIVPSPSAYLLPAHVSDKELLAQTVALAILDRVSLLAGAKYNPATAPDGRGVNLLAGLKYWQLRQMHLSLSRWNEDIIRWLLDGGSSGRSTWEPRPHLFEDLCLAYDVWMIQPATIGIPIYCGTANTVALLSPVSVQIRHDFPEGSFLGMGVTPLTDDLAEPWIWFTVIDYAATTYGRDRLSNLVAAHGQHDAWESLIPAVYGVSLDSFERDWRQYLARLRE